MAAQTCITSQHATLSGATADSIAFSGRGRTLRVTNRHATNDLYFNYNTDTVPVALADETVYVKAGDSCVITPGGLVTQCRVVGTDNGYSVSIA